jgi:predicted DNA-binding protein
MNRKTLFAAKIAFRLPTSLYVKLNAWAEAEDRPLANLVYTIVKQAVTEHEHKLNATGAQETLNREITA